MRIAVNLMPFRKHLAGAGRYAKCILNSLQTIDNQNEYVLFLTEKTYSNFGDVTAPNFTFQMVILPNRGGIFARILWEQTQLPFLLKQKKIDVLFTPSVVTPFFLPCKSVTTIHDMMPFLNGRLKKYPSLRAKYMQIMTALSCQRSTKILTESQQSKDDIVTFCNVPLSKIQVTSLGVDRQFRPVVDTLLRAECQQKYSLPTRYFLYVGTLEPGKNILRLIQAFVNLKSRLDLPHKLVLVGNWGWRVKEIKRIIACNQNDIVMLGFVNDDDLPILYSLAELFVFPSLYEGFGLPILEAMACGTPVLTSNVSSLPEVAGLAAYFVNPESVDSITEGMALVLNDEAMRHKKIQLGILQSQKFNWQDTASLTLRTFESALIAEET